jgi:hypothetical protein
MNVPLETYRRQLETHARNYLHVYTCMNDWLVLRSSTIPNTTHLAHAQAPAFDSVPETRTALQRGYVCVATVVRCIPTGETGEKHMRM